MLLGIGGVRAVRTYCRLTGHPEPEVFHTNEGHAGFLGLERIAELCDAGLDFDAGLEAVRAGTVFTTHTPVPAGIDRFDRELVATHFGPEAELPRMDVGNILRLGMETYPGGEPNLFNMAVMGLRLGQRANGVSLLHGAGQPRDVLRSLAGVRRRGGADHLRDQRGARADLGRPRGVPARARGRSAPSAPRTR
jgi:starch phosphorylase